MLLRSRSIAITFAAGLALAVFCLPLTAEDTLPDAPVPQQEASAPDRGSSSSQAAAPEADLAQQSHPDTAAEQFRAQKTQRVLWIVPNFSTTYISDAASLSAGQKMHMAFRTAVDPFTFATASVVAGLSELDPDPGFGWGPAGYFKRAGASYVTTFNADMIGDGVLPAVLHQDPRYFRRGHGTIFRRLAYAVAASFICKHDYTGRWEPNYSNVGGNLIAGAISNLYYPTQDSAWERTISSGRTVTTTGALGGILQEFWPDISRKLFHSDPTRGLDAQAAAANKAQTSSQEPAAQ